jgi:hypothetical protein
MENHLKLDHMKPKRIRTKNPVAAMPCGFDSRSWYEKLSPEFQGFFYAHKSRHIKKKRKINFGFL